MPLCAEMFLNCSILQANGKESQKELHAVWATVNALLMATAKAQRKKIYFSCRVVINFLLVWSTKGLVKNLTALWLTVVVRCRDGSITPAQVVCVLEIHIGFTHSVCHLHLLYNNKYFKKQAAFNVSFV